MERDDGTMCYKNYSQRCICQELCPADAQCLFRDELVSEVMQLDVDVKNLGAKTARLVSKVAPMLQQRMSSSIQLLQPCPDLGFDFRLTNNTQCTFCNSNHGDSPFSCVPLLDACCRVRNHQPHCRPGVIGMREHPILNKLLRDPDGDAAYGALFRAHQEARGLQWRFDGSDFYHFDGQRWKKMYPSDLGQALTTVLRDFLHDLRLLDGDEDEENERRKSSLQKAEEAIQKANKVSSIIRDCKNVYNDSSLSRRMDRDGHLLGCSNGVLDLDSEVFRPALAQDYISMSTNVSMPDSDAYDLEAMDEVRHFMAQLYPKEDEKHLIQR